MRHAPYDPGWLPRTRWQPRRPLPSRAALAAGRGAGRLALAGGRQVGTRWRPAMPLLVAGLAHLLAAVLRLVVVGLRHLHVSDHHGPVNVALVVFAVAALAPMWWVAAGWPFPFGRDRSRRWRAERVAHLAVGSLLLATYLPVSVWWLPPWRGLGAPWFPVALLTAAVAVAMWAWSYYGWYRVREVEEDEPEPEYGPAEQWYDEIGGPGKMLPGSRLTQVREIEVPT